MDPEFWHDRWRNETIGFHQTDVNRHLINNIGELALEPGDTVFVPLCGKSLDMWWLHEQGFKVIGIELSEIAVISFFSDAGKQALKTERDGFVSWKHADIEILCGDFFDLHAGLLGKICAVFDRAALIALPEEMRKKYVEKLATLIPKNAHGLLITLEYLQQEMSGPPFSVTSQEVQSLYAANYNFERIDRNDVYSEVPRFRDRGITEMHEAIYRFQRK